MTVFFKNHQITIYRNRRKGTANRWGMSATYTAFDADIQPASSVRQEQYGQEKWGAVFSGFVDTSANIKEGDKAVSEDGKVYSVKGVQRWDSNGLGGFAELDHLELVLVALDA